MNPITYTQARYLKHSGAIMGTKVSFCTRNNQPCCHIEDHEFDTFEKALRYLQRIEMTIARHGESEGDNCELSIRT